MKHFLLSVFLFLASFSISNADENNSFRFSTPYRGTPDFATTFVSICQEDDTIILLLSDGSYWKVNADFLDVLETWQKGDEIRLKEYDDDDDDEDENGDFTYLLKNIQSREALPAKLNLSITPSHCYVIEAIDRNGYLIVTQDGHQWAVGYFGSFTSCNWERGDRLIINKSTYSKAEDYCLINIDMEEDAWASLIDWK